MICTNNQEYSSKLKKLRFYGIDKNYTADIDGYNSRMDEIHAAILRYKLKKLDKNISERGKIAKFYKSHIKKNNLKPLNHPPQTKISNYLIPFLFNGDRDKFQEKLLREGRKFGLGIMLASQEVEDFSKVAYSNTETKFIFRKVSCFSFKCRLSTFKLLSFVSLELARFY